MAISQGQFFADFHEYAMYVGSPGGKQFKNVSNLSQGRIYETVVYHVKK